MNTLKSPTVKQFFEEALKKTDYGLNLEQHLGTWLNSKSLQNLPDSIQKAHSFYHKNFEDYDRGGTRIYQTTVDTVPVYTVYVFTDGDDGYLEIYTQTGEGIAYGKKYAKEIEWSDRDTLRSEAEIY